MPTATRPEQARAPMSSMEPSALAVVRTKAPVSPGVRMRRSTRPSLPSMRTWGKISVYHYPNHTTVYTVP